jgi:glyoxylate reductase
MLHPTIHLTTPLAEKDMETLKNLGTVKLQPLAEEGIHPDAQILIPMPGDGIDKHLLVKAPELRWIANHAVGTNNIDLDACRALEIRVTNTPGVLTEATAELAFLLLLAAARRFREGDALLRSGKWQGWEPTQLRGQELTGLVCGIVGLGRIGQAFARRARAFGMSIAYHQRKRNRRAEEDLGAEFMAFRDLCQNSDVISLHCPLNQETHHLLDEAALRHMRRGAILINTARGPVVDEAALVRVMGQGHLLAAGLDVFEDEPRTSPGLLQIPNVVALPHLGSATTRARGAMARLVIESVEAFCRGTTPEHLVV